MSPTSLRSRLPAATAAPPVLRFAALVTPRLDPADLSPGRLRRAAAGLFALIGLVFGSWAARVPDVSAHVHATPAQLGGALLCVSLGALAAMQLTGVVCTRLGPGLVSAAAAAALSASVVLPGLVSSPLELAAALLVFGGCTGAANVAANSLGVVVEARHGRPFMPFLHAGFSTGGLVGALVGGVLAATVGPGEHLLAVAGVGLLVVAVLAPTLQAADALHRTETVTAAEPRSAGRGSPARSAVLVLGALAACTAFGEGAISDWGALHLRTDLAATPAVASVGYAGFSLAMALGRLAGGPLLERLGQRRLLSGGGWLAAAGGLLVVLSPSVGPALAGFVLVGLGLANIFPLAIGRAGAVGGAGGVALASTIGYVGLLGGPPLIGLLAGWTGMAYALGSVPLLAAVAAVLARRVPVEHPGRDADAAALGTLALPLPRRRLAALADRCRVAADGHARDLDLLSPARGVQPAGERLRHQAGWEFLAG